MAQSRRQCPVCGGENITAHPSDGEYLVCGGCGETLEPAELVVRATQKTRADYAAANRLEDYEGYATTRLGRALRLPL